MPCRPIGPLLVALALAGGGVTSRAAAPVGPVAVPGHATAASAPLRARKPPPKPVKLIDINSAGAEQLKMLPGIGDAEAARIVAHRPYLSKTDLVSKAGLPAGTYLALKRLVVARQPAKTKPKA